MNLQLNRSHAHVNNIICRRINYWTTLTKPSIENRTSQRHFRYLEDAADGVRILIGAMVVENSCPVNFSFTPRSSWYNIVIGPKMYQAHLRTYAVACVLETAKIVHYPKLHPNIIPRPTDPTQLSSSSIRVKWAKFREDWPCGRWVQV